VFVGSKFAGLVLTRPVSPCATALVDASGDLESAFMPRHVFTAVSVTSGHIAFTSSHQLLVEIVFVATHRCFPFSLADLHLPGAYAIMHVSPDSPMLGLRRADHVAPARVVRCVPKRLILEHAARLSDRKSIADFIPACEHFCRILCATPLLVALR